jgi:hypothetical protein
MVRVFRISGFYLHVTLDIFRTLSDNVDDNVEWSDLNNCTDLITFIGKPGVSYPA